MLTNVFYRCIIFTGLTKETSAVKRLLDCNASDFKNMTKQELLASIAASEGRTIACETIGCVRPMLGDVTNAEFAAAMGADILLLNLFDVENPSIEGLNAAPGDVIKELKRLTGRPVGINLEPVENSQSASEETVWAAEGQLLKTRKKRLIWE